jgi:plasmid maintenance system antidote protein VapI
MSNDETTMTGLLRRTILEAVEAGQATYKGIGRDTGVCRSTVMRFATGKTSLRLDMADRLAAHFGIEARVKPKRRGK